MQFFFLFFLLVPLFLLLYHFLTKKYLNPYKLIFIFGKKGSGKSTLLVRLAIEYLKCGRPVYSTEKIPGTFHISYEDIGYKLFPPKSNWYSAKVANGIGTGKKKDNDQKGPFRRWPARDGPSIFICCGKIFASKMFLFC